MQGITEDLRQLATAHAVCAVLLAAGTGLLLRLRSALRTATTERQTERTLRQELEAYAALDLQAVPSETGVPCRESSHARARTLCRAIAECSRFSRVAVLLPNAQGRLLPAATIGMDDLTVEAFQRWGETAVAEEHAGPVAVTPGGAAPESPVRGLHSGLRSFSIPLGEWAHFDREVDSWLLSGKRERRRFRRAIVVPVRLRSGRLGGVLAVCTDGIVFHRGVARAEEATAPLELLAAKLGAALDTDLLLQRLHSAERATMLEQAAGQP